MRPGAAAIVAATQLAACAHAPEPPAPAGPRFELLWSDEFSGPAGAAPDPAVWQSELGNREADGWGNQELQYYTAAPRNAFLDGQGHLVIQAERQPGAGPCWNASTCDYSSARLITRGRVAFSYGKVEARLRVPAGQGLWPAFWSLGEGAERWPQQGEIDIMEYVGKTPDRVYGTIHGPGYAGAQGIGKPFVTAQPPADGFHVYAIVKRPHEIVWLVDGVEVNRVTPAQLPAGAPWVFERPFFLILNLAVGGHWPGPPDAGTRFPARMLVDWVRIHRERP